MQSDVCGSGSKGGAGGERERGRRVSSSAHLLTQQIPGGWTLHCQGQSTLPLRILRVTVSQCHSPKGWREFPDINRAKQSRA